jgi:hypothetical protein
MNDRAEELRACPDLWSEIAPYLGLAADIAASYSHHYAVDLERSDSTLADQRRAEMQDKFRAGEVEHGRDWLDMSKDDLEREIANEIRDLVIYHAMILARFR